ncbi:biopolymer transporter ExbD [Rhodovulum marinum]|uniref:Outer membrane transport energization protein ExbD n=1 Tax=Rhodovulum marinum TaxID=320662 RepID=A0A4R2Q5L5_9RHOB|nr:biopolymer transporter ExbD [Rhodovulum marinum]TCP44143.1 outer membrane transport energization protein ExbD [Rhodovulum marinum]
MRLSVPPPGPQRESVVPMINVVFLLLVFFLISAQLTPPEPFDIAAPAAGSDRPAEGQDILYVGADGVLAYRQVRGDAALDLLAAEPREGGLLVRADKAAPGAEIARLVARLAAVGVAPVEIVATGR